MYNKSVNLFIFVAEKYFHGVNMSRYLIVLLVLLLQLPLYGQSQSAKPRRGEGIGTFLIRMGRPGQTYYKEFLELNKKKLRGKEELLLGVSYLIPDKKGQTSTSKSTTTSTKKETASSDEGAKGSFNEPLFGSKLAKGKLDSNKLKNACFYIVSGHGGPDPGAIGRIDNHQLHEDEYAYDVALRLARDLMQEGATVRIIIQDAKDGIRDDRYLSNSKRETCMGSAIPLNQTERLKQRCDKINALYQKDKKQFKYCRAIFIHVDSRNQREETDVFFYHADGNQKGRSLARTMQQQFKAKYQQYQPGRGFGGSVGPRSLYVLRNTNPTSVFVELGNIQNTHDQKRFVLSSNRQALANWLLAGFLKDFDNQK